MSAAPALYRKLPFNPLSDFEYIGQVADVPMSLIAKTTLPPDNLKDLISYVRANKEKLNLGNASLGATTEIVRLTRPATWARISLPFFEADAARGRPA
jgi:tripartite-type tricarboxylate transporter receptor subunit TctC